MRSERGVSPSVPDALDPGSITDDRDRTSPQRGSGGAPGSATGSWLMAVVALVAFAAGVLLSGTLLPEGRGPATGLDASPSPTLVPSPPPTASPSVSPTATARPALGDAQRDARLEATLLDTFNGTVLTKWSITGERARETSALDRRLERIADLAGGVFWSYASAAPVRDPSPDILIEAVVIGGTTTGQLMDAYVAYQAEAAPDVQCSYATVLDRQVARCGAVEPDVWIGPHWVGTYAYVSGVTLYIVEGIGAIDDPWSLLFLQSIIAVLPA